MYSTRETGCEFLSMPHWWWNAHNNNYSSRENARTTVQIDRHPHIFPLIPLVATYPISCSANSCNIPFRCEIDKTKREEDVLTIFGIPFEIGYLWLQPWQIMEPSSTCIYHSMQGGYSENAIFFGLNDIPLVKHGVVFARNHRRSSQAVPKAGRYPPAIWRGLYSQRRDPV